MKKQLTLLTTLALVLLGCRRAGELTTTGAFASGMAPYDRAFARILRKWQIPGGALAVTDGGQLLLAQGYGLADVARSEPVLPQSLFRIASLSKPITAVAVLKLVEEGKLSLDTPAFRLIGDLAPLDGTDMDARIHEITIRHLLEHSAGWDASVSLDPMFASQRAAHGIELPVGADCTAIIRAMLARPLDFAPGTRYAYSNLGYCVLGRVIERVTGQPYEDYVRGEILHPIGIEGMRLGKTRLEERHPAEVRYYECGASSVVESVLPSSPGRVPAPYRGFSLEAMDAHGGWLSSAVDLTRFTSALDPAHPSPILNQETLEAMISRPAPPLWEGAPSYYALGWRVRPTRAGAARWHTGSLPGSTAVLYRTPRGRTWVALFNASPYTTGDEFLADVIAAMGRATVLSRVPWQHWPVVAVPAGILAAGLVLQAAARRPRPWAQTPGHAPPHQAT